MASWAIPGLQHSSNSVEEVCISYTRSAVPDAALRVRCVHVWRGTHLCLIHCLAMLKDDM